MDCALLRSVQPITEKELRQLIRHDRDERLRYIWAHLVSELRALSELHVDEVARKAELDPAAITLYQDAERLPTIASAIGVSRAFSIPAGVLVDWCEQRLGEVEKLAAPPSVDSILAAVLGASNFKDK